MMTLRQKLDYIEKRENVVIIDCLLYMQRQIFYADDNNYYLMLKAGTHQFPTLEHAMDAIRMTPEKYPTTRD